MGLQRFPYSRYDGGVNYRDAAFSLESNEAQDARNVSLTDRGAIYQREGKTLFTTTGFPASKRAEYSHAVFFGATRILMLSIDGDIYSMDMAGTITQRYNGTAGTIWDFEAALDGAGVQYVWCVNGTDAPQKWNGSAGSTSAWGGDPPNGKMLRVWKNRMCVLSSTAKTQRLWYSDIGNPELPTGSGDGGFGSNWVDIKSTEDELDAVTWVDQLGDDLIVFKRRSVWSIYDSITFANQRLGAPGCEGRFQSAACYGRLFFLSRDGVYSLLNSNDTPSKDSALLDPLFRDDLSGTEINRARMIGTRDNRLLIAVTVGSANDLLLEGWPAREGRRETGEVYFPWMIHDYPVESMCVIQIANREEVLAAASNTNKLHRLFVGTNDDGAAIDSYYFGRWNSLLSEEPYERVRRVNLEHSGRIVVSLYVELQSESPAFTRVVEREAADDPLWDGGVWDGGVWDPTVAVGLSRIRPEKRARYHALWFGNNVLDKSWKIYTAELVIRGGKEH